MRGFIDIRIDGAVATIALNRPDKANAMHRPLWNELRDAMRWLDETPTIRVGVLTGLILLAGYAVYLYGLWANWSLEGLGDLIIQPAAQTAD